MLLAILTSSQCDTIISWKKIHNTMMVSLKLLPHDLRIWGTHTHTHHTQAFPPDTLLEERNQTNNCLIQNDAETVFYCVTRGVSGRGHVLCVCVFVCLHFGVSRNCGDRFSHRYDINYMRKLSAIPDFSLSFRSERFHVYCFCKS